MSAIVKIFLTIFILSVVNCSTFIKPQNLFNHNSTYKIKSCIKNEYFRLNKNYILSIENSKFKYLNLKNNSDSFKGDFEYREDDFIYGNNMFRFNENFVCYFNLALVNSNKIFQFGKCFIDAYDFDLECVLKKIKKN